MSLSGRLNRSFSRLEISIPKVMAEARVVDEGSSGVNGVKSAAGKGVGLSRV